MGTVMHASVEKSCIWRRCLQKNRKFLISKKNCRMKKKFIFSCSCVDEPLDWLIIILKCTKLNQWIRSGLDYSDVIFASAKFRAAAKIEKTSTATCLFLVKNLGNFLNIFNTNYRSKLQNELYKEEFEQGLGRHHKAKSRIFYSPPILALNHYWKEHNFFFIFVFSTLVSMF